MTLRADNLFQKLLDPLHALFVLHFRKGVFYGIDGIEIGKIQFSRLIRAFGMIKNMLFLRGTVINNFFFALGQITERYIGTHPHRTADLGHQ